MDIVNHQDWQFVSSKECNFESPKNVDIFLNDLKQKPSIIINAAAYTAVDLAEEEHDKAMNINAKSVGIIAKYCKKNDITLFHYSTDYIFDGTKNGEYSTNDIPNPVNFYGTSKLMGEQEIIKSGCKYYILRISWVYSQYGKNFLQTIIKLIQDRDEIQIVNDQIGSPTSAIDIANITMLILKKQMPFGVYHFTNEGFCSWYEFACEIIDIVKSFGLKTKIQNIKSIPTKNYPTLAKRPLNSKMNKGVLNDDLQPWKDSLKQVMDRIFVIDNCNKLGS